MVHHEEIQCIELNSMQDLTDQGLLDCGQVSSPSGSVLYLEKNSENSQVTGML